MARIDQPNLTLVAKGVSLAEWQGLRRWTIATSPFERQVLHCCAPNPILFGPVTEGFAKELNANARNTVGEDLPVMVGSGSLGETKRED
jgi:hypothetical protein